VCQLKYIEQVEAVDFLEGPERPVDMSQNFEVGTTAEKKSNGRGEQD